MKTSKAIDAWAEVPGYALYWKIRQRRVCRSWSQICAGKQNLKDLYAQWKELRLSWGIAIVLALIGQLLHSLYIGIGAKPDWVICLFDWTDTIYAPFAMSFFRILLGAVLRSALKSR